MSDIATELRDGVAVGPGGIEETEECMRRGAEEIERLKAKVHMMENSVSSRVVSLELELDEYKQMALSEAAGADHREQEIERLTAEVEDLLRTLRDYPRPRDGTDSITNR